MTEQQHIPAVRRTDVVPRNRRDRNCVKEVVVGVRRTVKAFLEQKQREFDALQSEGDCGLCRVKQEITALLTLFSLLDRPILDDRELGSVGRWRDRGFVGCVPFQKPGNLPRAVHQAFKV